MKKLAFTAVVLMASIGFMNAQETEAATKKAKVAQVEAQQQLKAAEDTGAVSKEAAVEAKKAKVEAVKAEEARAEDAKKAAEKQEAVRKEELSREEAAK